MTPPHRVPAIDGLIQIPIAAHRIDGILRPVEDERFQGRATAAVFSAGTSDILVGAIGGEQILQPDGVADVEAALALIERYAQVHATRIDRDGSLMLRFEAIAGMGGSRK